MKKLFFQSLLAITVMVFAFSTSVFSQANTSLSNLTSPTSVNQNLIPSSDNSKDLGTSTTTWRSGYFKTTLFLGGSSATNGIQMNPNTSGKPLELRFLESSTNGTNYVGFKAPTAITANKIWILPAADGTSGQVLSTNGSGTLSWATAGSGGGVGSNTFSFIPKWDGTALVTGTLKDTISSITNGNYSKKGRMTIYRNSGLFVDDGVSAVQGIGTTTTGGTIYSKGFLAAKDLNELVDQEFFPPFSSSLDNAGVMGYITSNASAEGAALVGLNQGTASNAYGMYAISNGSGANKYGSYSIATADGGTVDVNTGTYGEASSAATNVGVWGVATGGLASTATYGVYGKATGTFGSIYSGYFEGAAKVTNYFVVGDSANVNKTLVVGSAKRPNAYEFAVTGGADAYFDDKLSVQTTTATASLNVKGSSETILMEGTTPYMKLIDGTSQASFMQANGNDMRIGTLSGNTAGKIVFRFNGTNKNAMDVNGNLGLGTISPSALLHLKGSNEVLKIEGTDANIGFYSSGTQKAFIQRSGDNLKIASNAGNIIFGNNITGDQLWILSDGRIGIGTSTPKTGCKLSVEGKIACRELKVETATWPDYVFENNYKLLPLPELENFISTNNHLPGIPSATELEQDGISVGDMQNKLMQKVEELTLYVIELQKQNTALAQKVSQLETK